MLSIATSPLSFSAPVAPMAPRSVAVRMQESMPSKGFSVKDLPGVTSPFGFFDPAGFCEDASEGKIKFYRGAPATRHALRPGASVLPIPERPRTLHAAAHECNTPIAQLISPRFPPPAPQRSS
jgi:hypothetical protein